MDVPKARAPVRRTGGGEGVENSAGQMRVTGGGGSPGKVVPNDRAAARRTRWRRRGGSAGLWDTDLR